MIKKIDARGLSCPKPVVMTKNALEEIEAGAVEVLVDNKPAVENVSRFARNSGCEVKARAEGKNFVVEVTKNATSEVSDEQIVCPVKPQNAGKGIVILIESDSVGRGSDELGAILMRALFPTLLEADPRPRKVILMNSGAKLAVEGSLYLEDIGDLEKEGIEIFVCGTCLDFFHLKDKVKVGKISNFFEITQTLVEADKVITI
jgi:selenium metabolism protein YedF